MKKNSLASTYLKLLLMALFWGGTFVAGRSLAGKVGPLSAAFLRFAMASVFLTVIACRRGERLFFPKGRQLASILLLGLTGISFYNFFFFSGLHHIEAGRAAVIIANNPIILALLSALVFNEKLNLQKSVGILLSVSGAVVVITKGHPLSLFNEGVGPGEMLIAGAVFSWVAYSMIGKVVMADLSPLLSVTYSVIAGTVMLAIPAGMEGVFSSLFSYGPWQWFSLFYLAFFGTALGFVFYYEGIKTIGPTRAALFINFVPVSAVLSGFVILGEALTLSLLAGLVLVSSGVYLTNAQNLFRRQDKRSENNSS
ncbi:Permease of the drug/metabolite transporter (DMT) superfamily [Desulfatibacillum alkenivorans DSM 16219]|jgi:drug/metabolite transporter (DMT)-like permease|uniref:Permease of the drug/metabolite transporter (DMT) superfamily n=1 Tax=Desulfatibacillum alkenivorans DSM 16219 TaxID=1121393 RepID=A0A1M6SH84_9BACT|nr:DMT family transporter [Desulfatibacillum alkenivorans]SHK44091.1 Permease of the drug/metabolite transporter (DMT) superfamily [Desulfatibacillum alkenivorans DSM 16219]